MQIVGLSAKSGTDFLEFMQSAPDFEQRLVLRMHKGLLESVLENAEEVTEVSVALKLTEFGFEVDARICNIHDLM